MMKEKKEQKKNKEQQHTKTENKNWNYAPSTKAGTKILAIMFIILNWNKINKKALTVSIKINIYNIYYYKIVNFVDEISIIGVFVN